MIAGRIRPFALALAVWVLGHHTSEAFSYAGTGTSSCGTWVSDRQNSYGTAAQQWVLGFLAGAAAWGPNNFDPLGETDANGVWVWLDRYCWQNPTTSILDAIDAFSRERRAAEIKGR